MDFEECFLQHGAILSDDDIARVADHIEVKEYKARDVLLYSGEVCQHLFFLKRGLVRCHSFEDDRTLWCEFENTFFTSPRSFYQQCPSSETLSFLEPSLVYSLSHTNLMMLYHKSHRWALWGVKFMEAEYLKLESIYQSLFYEDATERYHKLISVRPDVVTRIPLKYIASFLGVSQVTLSRIRAGNQKRQG
ncbi:Crp/Fnr family transcriptional regulator [Cesiribacter sp. SM1]|uniref:Crp/Fnr family transcriptional regulator n=1 Tax=Cesiribacter sp. SM1 TaxID=2861196 RepID=UPI001CD3FD7D|nr:Crp/Fnr family transcriptional regulator [Cesiribacter sp. SM1]